MICTIKVIVCGNEHGTGDVTFPRLDSLDAQNLQELVSLTTLRHKAKAEGWGRVNHEDYCPGCMESM